MGFRGNLNNSKFVVINLNLYDFIKFRNKIVNENPFLIQAYLKDKNKQLPNADVWFKSSVERQIYTTLYPKASQLIIL